VRGYACWVRSFRRALKDHNYIRCGEQTRYLREAELTMMMAPQPSGNEVYYGPAWAVVLITALRHEAKEAQQRLTVVHVAELLRTSKSYGPVPPELITRLEALRAFAVLRGWRYEHGMWYR